MQAEATGVSAFNVHALTRAIDEFRPDVAYVWMIVGVGGLGLMATLQHLRVPWLWHLMDDVPVALCRFDGRVIEPLLREVDRQLDGRYLACSRQLVDEIEAGGVRLRPDVEVVPNWVVGEPPAPRAEFYRPGQTLADHRRRPDRPAQGGRPPDRGRRQGPRAGVREPPGRHLRERRGPLLPDAGPPARARPTTSRFQGSRPQAELARLYPTYDVFAFPTWHREPFAFAPLEASLAGVRPADVAAQRQRRVGRPRGPLPQGRPDARRLRRLARLDPRRLGRPRRRSPGGPPPVIGRDFHLDAQVPKIERALAEAADAAPGRRRDRRPRRTGWPSWPRS